MANFRSQPMSRSDLRAYALDIRRELSMENEMYLPIECLFEIMPSVFESDGFWTHVVEDDELEPSIHALYIPEENCIRVKNTVYERACAGYGRDRMTLAHEIGHYLLVGASKIEFHRSYGEQVRPYEDPEWQAKCFAGELLIPAHLVAQKGPFTPHEIATLCGVSVEAAKYQLSKINEKQ